MGLIDLLEGLGITNLEEYKEELEGVECGVFEEQIKDYFDFDEE
ncbi:MAG: hypothetical protein ACRCTS_06970 [Fusobacteriaceae bacterium]